MLTLSEVSRGRQYNFMIFSDASIDFWRGIIPYGAEWGAEKGHDVFLYGPLFNILFTPFIYMPQWLAPFAWNIINFSLYFLAIFTLPDRFTTTSKCRTFLYTLPILATTLLSFQYNVVVAYIFIFAFSLLERGKYKLAIILILLSAFTKIYGIFQIGMLIFYPKILRHIGYIIPIAIAYTLVPLIKIPVSEIAGYYGSWFTGLTEHDITRTFHTIFYIKPLFQTPPTWTTIAQIISITLLAFMILANRCSYSSFSFRIQSLGILMGWVILFGTSSEYHTYVIALLGYMLWYYSRKPSIIDKILYWTNFIVLVLMPIDLLCPTAIWRFTFLTITLNIWIFTITWIRMIIITFLSKRKKEQLTNYTVHTI
ncbi:MAG: glycosyltransferase family 87 protein [Bacteroidales bacterium]